ncbi:MAG TPA: cation:proton antiporter [Burkholderiaceae bacterium]
MLETTTWAALAHLADMAWPLVLLLAWVLGELLNKAIDLPRISTYALLGFVAAPAQAGLLPVETPNWVLLAANAAFGLMLFEFGHRINLRWFAVNRWLLAVGLLESAVSFAAVAGVAWACGLSERAALLLGALSIATSPAAVMRVIDERRSAGQITERLVHLAGLNCMLSVLVFKALLGLMVFEHSGSLLAALHASSVMVGASVLLGLVFGAAALGLVALLARAGSDNTVLFALAVIVLVALTQTLQLSPIVAALSCGLMARHQRSVLRRSERGFGAFGDMLTVLLFVFIASRLDARPVVAGLALATVLVATRLLAKVGSVGLLARASGMSLKKGMLTGLAMAPLSAYAVLLLEQVQQAGIDVGPDLLAQLAPLASMTLVLDLLAPVLMVLALGWGRELQERGD